MRTAADLDVLLERLAGEARAEGMPQDVQLTVEGAGTLGIVVGDDRSVLNHVPDDLDPPYMVSIGSEASEEPFVFYVAGDHYSEGLRRNAIPPAAARAAMRHFLTTGALSPEVEWEQVLAPSGRVPRRPKQPDPRRCGNAQPASASTSCDGWASR